MTSDWRGDPRITAAPKREMSWREVIEVAVSEMQHRGRPRAPRRVRLGWSRLPVSSGRAPRSAGAGESARQNRRGVPDMGKVRAIPEGMHTITPHLTVKGAANAIDYYKRAFGATVLSQHDGPNGLIMHSALRIGDSTFFLNDEFPGMSGCASPKTYG